MEAGHRRMVSGLSGRRTRSCEIRLVARSVSRRHELHRDRLARSRDGPDVVPAGGERARLSSRSDGHAALTGVLQPGDSLMSPAAALFYWAMTSLGRSVDLPDDGLTMAARGWWVGAV